MVAGFCVAPHAHAHTLRFVGYTVRTRMPFPAHRCCYLFPQLVGLFSPHIYYIRFGLRITKTRCALRHMRRFGCAAFTALRGRSTLPTVYPSFPRDTLLATQFFCAAFPAGRFAVTQLTLLPLPRLPPPVRLVYLSLDARAAVRVTRAARRTFRLFRTVGALAAVAHLHTTTYTSHTVRWTCRLRCFYRHPHTCLWFLPITTPPVQDSSPHLARLPFATHTCYTHPHTC